jgi:hypothetical protein
MRTTLKKSIDKELESKLLLQDASLWQVTKSLYRKHTSEVWCFVCALIVGLGVGGVIL